MSYIDQATLRRKLKQLGELESLLLKIKHERLDGKPTLKLVKDVWKNLDEVDQIDIQELLEVLAARRIRNLNTFLHGIKGR